jgi:hypothetical protein
MRKYAVIFFGLAVVGLLGGVSAAAQEANPTVDSAKGVWRLNTEKSDFNGWPKPKSLRLVITENTPAALKWRVSGIGAEGKAVHESFSGAIDGKSYPLAGNPQGQSVAYTSSGNEVLGTVTGGGATIKLTITMSEDKNTMTVKGEGTGPNGPINYTEIWERVRAGVHRAAAPPAQ